MTTDRITLPVPAHALPHRSARQLLDMARQGLDQADTRGHGMRYANAHLAALRAAAAVLAERADYERPARPRQPVTSVWVLLAQVAPELAEWSTFFAERAGKRAAAEAGVPRAVTLAEADEMVRVAGQFVDIVEQHLGLKAPAEREATP